MSFDDEHIIGTVFVDQQPRALYSVVNGGIEYCRENGAIYEYVKVERTEIDADTGETQGIKPLYTNRCKICYPLPDSTEIKEA